MHRWLQHPRKDAAVEEVDASIVSRQLSQVAGGRLPPCRDACVMGKGRSRSGCFVSVKLSKGICDGDMGPQIMSIKENNASRCAH